jgi:hypothetical protein
VAAKAALSNATCLGHPDPTARLALHVDTSSSHIGAALHKQLKGRSTWQSLGFFSHKLEAVQAKRSAFDRELFACVEGIQHFLFISRAEASPSTRITSRSWGLWRVSLIPGRHASVVTWPT